MKNELEDMLIQGAYFFVLTTALVTAGYMQARSHVYSDRYSEHKTEQQKIYHVEKDKEYKK